MTQRKIWTPNDHDNRGLIALARRVRIRPRVPPRARVGVSYEPQYLHWQVINPDGSIAQEGEQHNLLLDVYKSLVPTYGFTGGGEWGYRSNPLRGIANYAVVGTGSSAPSPTQTALDAEVARVSPGWGWTQDSVEVVADGVYDLKYVREFSPGTFNDTPLTEWGFSPSGTSGDPLMSRELFRDASGAPITLVVSSSQTLRFVYYVRATLSPVTPQPASIAISGLGTLTGQFMLQRYTYGGTYQKGPLLLADVFARADGGSNLYYYQDTGGNYSTGVTPQLGVLRATTDMLFTSATRSPSRTTHSPVYNAPGANSRTTRAEVFSASEAVGTVYGFVYGLYTPNDYNLIGRYVFQLDAGQEFTKDNAHTLTVDSFTLSW